ncbi:MAG: aminoacyl-tRNA hydrolase [Spirochaetaceae bacterium]|jgi:PTH1 family peptidyl-tRNA hydrolase|nr:aminoacyl-tRNA hydrolase [Spirochaetaceae bacterium]
MIELAVFLGNPGNEYRNARHNAGWMLAEKMAAGAAPLKRFKGAYTAARIGGGGGIIANPRICHFLLPETYMNNSGEAAREAASFFKIKAEAVLVVHDELEMKLGEAGFKFGGGLGGHNGLRSIASCLGTPDFWRLRLGIGRPGGVKERGQDILNWVLGNFTAEEKERFDLVLDAAADALKLALEINPAALLPEWRKKKI